jgi:hypothetical protein
MQLLVDELHSAHASTQLPSAPQSVAKCAQMSVQDPPPPDPPFPLPEPDEPDEQARGPTISAALAAIATTIVFIGMV